MTTSACGSDKLQLAMKPLENCATIITISGAGTEITDNNAVLPLKPSATDLVYIFPKGTFFTRKPTPRSASYLWPFIISLLLLLLAITVAFKFYNDLQKEKKMNHPLSTTTAFTATKTK